ncbi:MAG: OmpA family protein [Bacteroidota bacterium]
MKIQLIKNDSFNFWAILVDMIASIMVVFLLINFVDNVLNTRNLEALIIEKNRLVFYEKYLKAEFSDEIKSGQLNTISDETYLRIILDENILSFETQDYELKPAGEKIIERFAVVFTDALKESTIDEIQVEGHADRHKFNVSTFPKNNWELSSARATKIVNKLIESNKTIEPLLSANGYSSHRPRSENIDHLNRRIEIKIYFHAENQINSLIR